MEYKLDDLNEKFEELTKLVYTHDHQLIPESADKNYCPYTEKYIHIRQPENSKDLWEYIKNSYGYIEHLVKRVERLENELENVRKVSFQEIPKKESVDPRCWPIDTFKINKE